MRQIVFILALILVLPAYGQRKKKEGEALVSAFTEGITYSLPRTGVRIQVKAVKEAFEPGPYVSYADQLLGIKNAKTRATVKWVIEEVKISTFSEPDPEQVFKAMGDAAFLVAHTPDGCLAGINSKPVSDEVKKVITNRVSQKPEKEDGFSFANLNHSSYYSAGDSNTGYQTVRMSIEQKAAEAAKRIFDCRVNQYDLVAGRLDEFHPDGEAYKVSLEELKTMENNYLSLFTGRTTYNSETFEFDFVPTASSEKGEVVFRISDEKGIVPASDLSGKPVMLKVEPEKGLINKYAGLKASQNPAAGESGVFYRMPGVATINIIYEMQTIATSRLTLPQFGTVMPVPEELLYGEYSIEIHPETGAIKSIFKK